MHPFGLFKFEGGELRLKGTMAEIVIPGNLAHLNSSFPIIKDRVKIEGVRESNGTLRFSSKLYHISLFLALYPPLSISIKPFTPQSCRPYLNR